MASPYANSAELIDVFKIKVNALVDKELSEKGFPVGEIKPSGAGNAQAASEQLTKDLRAGVYGPLAQEFYNAKQS
ncbi:MAG: hypothetical protein Q4G02_02025 [bacterium]|nr:hypothetical protein [bacterium]